jgi:hypothetical protein
MRTYSHAIVASLLGVAALTLSGSARAATLETTLDRLIPGGANEGGITIGDKRYTDFTFSPTGNSAPAASSVGVSLISDEATNQYQIRFNFAVDPLDASAGQHTDVVITYRVNVTDESTQLINRVGLAFDGTVVGGNGAAKATVVESILTTDRTDVSPAYPGQDQVEITVVNDGPLRDPDNNTSTLNIHPTRQLEFRKDILVSSAAGGGRVTINTVDNFIYQVPEPSSAALLGMLGGPLLFRRHRRAAT